MPNSSTISTAEYRVELAAWTDLWMRGARYGTVLREYKARKTGFRMVLVKLDSLSYLVRLPADAVTPIE